MSFRWANNTNQYLLQLHMNHRVRFPADFNVLLLPTTENAFLSHGPHDLKGPLWNFLFMIHVPGQVGLGHRMQSLNSEVSSPAQWLSGEISGQDTSTLKKKPGPGVPGLNSGWGERVFCLATKKSTLRETGIKGSKENKWGERWLGA